MYDNIIQKLFMSITHFRGSHAFLSNFYETKIYYKDNKFTSIEQAYQFAKANNDIDRNLILQSKTPVDAKKLGRKIKCDDDWNDIKLDVMKDLLKIKFANQTLKELLEKTGDTYISEGNYWHDNFWGICTCKKCNNSGQNNLGQILMGIRDDKQQIL